MGLYDVDYGTRRNSNSRERNSTTFAEERRKGIKLALKRSTELTNLALLVGTPISTEDAIQFCSLPWRDNLCRAFTQLVRFVLSTNSRTDKIYAETRQRQAWEFLLRSFQTLQKRATDYRKYSQHQGAKRWWILWRSFRRPETRPSNVTF